MTRPSPVLDRSVRSNAPAPTRTAGIRVGLPGILALAAVLLLPSALPAQQGEPTQRQLITQLQQINKQLQPIRQRALQDSALQTRQDSLVERVRARMKAQSDTTASQVERAEELQAEMREALQAQDTARAKQIQSELQGLSRALTAARKKAMKAPEVQERLQAFQQAVRAEMREISPSADSLLSRADSLRSLLREQMGGGGGTGG